MLADGNAQKHVPPYVTRTATLIAICAFLFWSFLGLAVFQPREAFAFEQGGVTYPDDLRDKTVTFNRTLTAPPSSLTGTYFPISAYSPSSPSNMPENYNGTLLYVSFENWSSVSGSSHPWFVFFSFKPSQTDTTVPSGTGVSYYGRFAYDGYNGVTAWWGLKSGLSYPTVHFNATQPNPNQTGVRDILTDQAFIVWLCSNSDYFSRYPTSTESWVDPVVSQVDSSFGWSMPDSNPPSALDIFKGNLIVKSYAASPYTGSYTATTSGTYKFRWTYVLNGSTLTYTSPTYSVLVNEQLPVFNSVIVEHGVVLSNVDITANVSNATRVELQRFTGDQWTYVLDLDLDSGTTWTVSTSFALGYNYRLVAYNSSGSTGYDLSNENLNPDDGNNSGNQSITQYLSLLGQWVSQLLQAIPNLFAWIPDEIQLILFSVLACMIILGLIGWLKP